jgi:hypothetical protein
VGNFKISTNGKHNYKNKEYIMANSYNPKQAAQKQHQDTQPQVQTQGATPGLAKVSQQHAIAKTKADIAAVQVIAQKRTQIVLQAFDQAMADSDADIIAALEQRLGAESDGFFGFDLEAEFAALLTKKEPETDEPPAGEQTIDAPALAVPN